MLLFQVGVLIGKAGDTIKFLQHNSGARIQITRDADVDPHSSTRTVELIGTLENINKAEQLIKDVIAEVQILLIANNHYYWVSFSPLPFSRVDTLDLILFLLCSMAYMYVYVEVRNFISGLPCGHTWMHASHMGREDGGAMMPRYGMYTAGTRYGYIRDTCYTKAEVSNMIRHDMLPILKYPCIIVCRSRQYYGCLKNQPNQIIDMDS